VTVRNSDSNVAFTRPATSMIVAERADVAEKVVHIPQLTYRL
jgi:hypothetical protein